MRDVVQKNNYIYSFPKCIIRIIIKLIENTFDSNFVLYFFIIFTIYAHLN